MRSIHTDSGFSLCFQVSMHNKDNQSYLIVFDGSLLVSTLTR